MRFTNIVAVITAALALNACAAEIHHDAGPSVARTPAQDHAACERLVYRTPAPDKEAALKCANRLDLWP
jgi:hypothetical protein